MPQAVQKQYIPFLNYPRPSDSPGNSVLSHITINLLAELMYKRFVADYPREELAKYEDLLEDAYRDYPYSMIYILESYEEFIQGKNYFKAFVRGINFIEISLQYCSSVMLSLLKENGIAFDESLQNLTTKIVSKPLSMGDWVNDIFIVLLKKSIELIPDEPFVQSLDRVLLERKGNVLQGWSGRKGEEFQSISYFRNKYVGHSMLLEEEKYNELLKILEPRILKMVEAMLPLAEYSTFSVVDIVNDDEVPGEYLVAPLKGSQLPRPMTILSDEKVEEGKYYLVKRKIRRFDHVKAEELIPVTPFVIYQPVVEEKADAEKTTFVFQSVKQGNLKRLEYVSPHPGAEKRETEMFKELFRIFLEEAMGKSIVGENYKIELIKGKTWEEYLERFQGETKKFLGQMKAEKYVPQLYVDRAEIREIWNRFLEMEGKRACVLLGNAGSGKTNLICKLAEEAIEDKSPVITFNSSIFSGISLEKKLEEILEEKAAKMAGSLEEMNKMAVKNGKKVFLLFDAINECLEYDNQKESNGPVELLQAIDKVLIDERFSNFKVLVTCRTYTWEEAISGKKETLNLGLYLTTEDIPGISENKNISLKGFTEHEFKEVYPKYREEFNLETELETLLEPDFAFTRTRLSDPLVLKLACQIYAGDNLPANLRQFDSVKLFSNRLENIEDQEDGEEQLYILQEFTQVMKSHRTDAIRLKALYSAFKKERDELHEFSKELFDGDIANWRWPARKLLDSGILRIDRTPKYPELRFTYERFHEYMYASVFYEEESDKVDDDMPVPASAFEEQLREMRGYAVIDGALRHALVMDYDETDGDPATIIDLANSTVYGAAQLVMNTLNSLILDNYEEVCRIISKLLKYKSSESQPLAEELEKKEVLIEEGQKGKKKLSEEEIEQTNKEIEELQNQLQPVIQVRKIAVQVIYEIFKSPVFTQHLYKGKHSPFELLWEAMGDPMAKVRDNVSLYIYYISKYDVDIGKRILNHLSEKILDTSLLSLARSSKRKEFQQSFVEPAGRLSLLMVIEGLVVNNDYELSTDIKHTWREILKKLTLKFSLIKIVMPFLKFFLRRQATVQVAYVNNGIEYQHFWEAIPESGPADSWSRESFKSLVPFLDPNKEGIEEHYKAINEGVDTGDAFSYFLIERVLVTQGWADWERIKPVVMEVVNKPPDQAWLDYMQMSMLYVLFHSIEKSDELNDEAFDVFSELTEEWSERCRGLFFAHNNQQANKGLPYKQYPLNWYGAAYCKHFGDGGTRPGDPYPLPVFRNLIDKAFEEEDKELLYYCIENIATLVTDFSRPLSAIQLFDYVIGLFEHESEIKAFDKQETEREEHQKDLRTFLCSMIGTIKSYYPKEVAHFIHHKLAHSSFPDMERFREDLVNYNQSHESIGDLLTHKFGNFIIWGLLHDNEVGRFFMDGFKVGGEVKDYFGWFDGIVRLSFNRLFGIKV
jgi:hypothetical protein